MTDAHDPSNGWPAATREVSPVLDRDAALAALEEAWRTGSLAESDSEL